MFTFTLKKQIEPIYPKRIKYPFLVINQTQSLITVKKKWISLIGNFCDKSECIFIKYNNFWYPSFSVNLQFVFWLIPTNLARGIDPPSDQQISKTVRSFEEKFDNGQQGIITCTLHLIIPLVFTRSVYALLLFCIFL